MHFSWWIADPFGKTFFAASRISGSCPAMQTYWSWRRASFALRKPRAMQDARRSFLDLSFFHRSKFSFLVISESAKLFFRSERFL